MVQESELVRRLRNLPPDRRAEFLRNLENVSRGARVSPLSFRQEQLWVLDKISRASAGYALVFAFRLEGELSVEALEGALDDVLERHTVLRSVMPHEHADGAQVLRPARPARPTVEKTAAEELDARCAAVVREELERGFDLDNGPLVRHRLLAVDDRTHVLLWVTHHLVFDRRSAGVVLRDLMAAYEARLGGGRAAGAAAPHFGEYASWQRDWVRGPEAAAAAAWWKETLAGWESTEIPADLPRGRLLDLTAETVSAPLDAPVREAAAALADRLGVAAGDVFLAAFLSVLGRVTARRDLVVGLPVNVPGPFDPAALVGDCGNLQPVRVEVEGAPGLAEIARRVHRARTEGERHAALPFKLILEAVGVEPDPGRLPLVQVGFELRDDAAPRAEAGPLRAVAEQVETGGATLELDLVVQPDLVRVRYVTALYRRGTAELLLERYLRVLAAGCAGPDVPHERLPLAGADERRVILEEWNVPVGRREPELIHKIFEERARERPGAVAVAGRDTEITYAELDRRANGVAARLRELGVGPEDFVAVAPPRGPRLAEAVLGVLKAGAAYVPVDLGNPAGRIAAILDDSAARIVIGDRETLAGLPEGRWQGLDLDEAGERDEAPPIEVPPSALAYAIFTSGSTGRPKGVLVEHRNVVNFIRTVQEMFSLTPDDRVVQFASPGFDVSTFELFSALLTGARLYAVDDEERRSIDRIDAVLAEQRITVIDLPPAIMELLDPARYPDLRIAFVGGEAFTGELTTRWAAGRRFYNGYGPTETTVTVVAKLCEGVWRGSPPIGRAMTNHRAYTLDGEMGLQPAGAVGELAVAGAGLGRGYLGRPDLTAERFRPDPYGEPGSRVYLTGDLAAWNADGDLVFHGRADRQVKIRGVRIELGEVESALLTLPEVGRAVAEAVPDPRGGSLLVAYLVPAEGATLQLDTVRGALTERLPPPMVPSFLIPLDEVPLTLSGKVNRKALPPVRFADPVEQAEAEAEERTETERRVADEVFLPLLRVPRVSKHDNFFALGGTSLQAIRIAPRVKAVFDVDLPIADFFQNPTVTGMAQVVEGLVARRDEARRTMLAALEFVEGRTDEEVADLLGTPGGER
ncbi:amino acid adenylation domain-containing protein [Streptosporangium becharense]|uniref:Amino acid adenylation domain-containing protein n=1 Tax=Streptosporangium becharense TaxID=1816182 RepID=A0A7W9MJJ6_9ACTN|nr:non-ribosomal peptide synthetase [Streptosporangium becharense]MBB2910392.1 amino acid adenylation domain-containing protein [Streptosporangium becharense]MBB5823135.1 amino acid adenylation domain-containing protein [Streptosporangium becharense]